MLKLVTFTFCIVNSYRNLPVLEFIEICSVKPLYCTL